MCVKAVCGLQGIYVTRITPGGPAEDADLRIGDKIMQVGSNNSRHWMQKPQDGVVGSSKKKKSCKFYCLSWTEP